MSDEARVVFRGVSMAASWPERIRQAQLEPFCYPDGVETERVRYGSERSDWGADRGPCHDCGVVKGEYHVPGCDVERCPICDGQIGGCDCDWPDEDDDEDDDDDHDDELADEDD